MNVFLDSNLLVYSFDNRYPDKRDKAKLILQSLKTGTDLAVISTQVMQEVYNILTRKLSIKPVDAAAELRILAALHTVILTPDLILVAAGLHITASLSFWDALIVTAAQQGDARNYGPKICRMGKSLGAWKLSIHFSGGKCRS